MPDAWGGREVGGVTREWHLLLMVEVERAKWWKARVVCDPVALYLCLPKPEIWDLFPFCLSLLVKSSLFALDLVNYMFGKHC